MAEKDAAGEELEEVFVVDREVYMLSTVEG